MRLLGSASDATVCSRVDVVDQGRSPGSGRVRYCHDHLGDLAAFCRPAQATFPSTSRGGQRAGGIRGICDQITKNGSITKIVIVKEEIRGEGAVVIADVT